jgi:hypothetical protein
MSKAALTFLFKKTCKLNSIFAVIVLEVVSKKKLIDFSVFKLSELPKFFIGLFLILNLHCDYFSD